MAIFKDHKINIKQLLGVIPDALLNHLSENTKVDYYSKVLQGKKMFYLLIYGLLENNRLSQRTLEDTFNDPVFKMLFNLDMEESIRRSSISERLSKIDSVFFKQIYENIYEQFSQLYSSAGGKKYNLIRVDSTIVSDISGKMSAELENNGRKSIKYTMAFDGILPCLSEIFTEPTYSSADMALPEVVKNHIKQELNVSHLISLNTNGIEVMLYMTLIAAMLILIYKHINNIGYKTAKRRFTMEMRNLIISMIVVECGGDPAKLFKT
jgi:hypothetical protein